MTPSEGFFINASALDRVRPGNAVVVRIEDKVHTVLFHDGAECGFDVVIISLRIYRIRRLVEEDDLPLRFAGGQVGFQPGFLNR